MGKVDHITYDMFLLVELTFRCLWENELRSRASIGAPRLPLKLGRIRREMPTFDSDHLFVF